jgi:hypothetical protein
VRNCEQYGGWMTHAALGALNPMRERELLAHVGECEVCREAYRHACELAALVDRGVESVVAGEPSPHFAARLRVRIAEEPARTRFNWFGWKPAAAALAVVLLVAALVFFRGTPRTNPQPAAARVASEANSNAARSSSQPKPHNEVASEQPAVAAGHAQRPLVARRQSTREREPEVIVPPGQLEAVMQLAADIRSGRIDGKQLVAANAQANRPVDIAPIEIAPLDTPRVDAVASPDASTNSSHP